MGLVDWVIVSLSLGVACFVMIVMTLFLLEGKWQEINEKLSKCAETSRDNEFMTDAVESYQRNELIPQIEEIESEIKKMKAMCVNAHGAALSIRTAAAAMMQMQRPEIDKIADAVLKNAERYDKLADIVVAYKGQIRETRGALDRLAKDVDNISRNGCSPAQKKKKEKTKNIDPNKIDNGM